ncbi:MAG: metal-dependent hydrolase [Chromatiaceae bacterium]
MDSISQAALGAAVGVAVMGRTRPVWQAALTGAVVGTLPDLDVFVDQGDPIRNMVLHRAETHALFWQALASPVLGLLLAVITNSRPLLRRWWLMVVLTLFTHSALDAMTVYGTQIALPFSNYPVGLGSLFIIDPLYTLPLLVGLIVSLFMRTPHRRRWNTLGLALSTLYAAWSLLAQAYVTTQVRQTIAASDLPAQQILVTPTPFNTLLWRIVLMSEDEYREGFYSLLDPLRAPQRPLRFERFPRGAELDRRTVGLGGSDHIRAFSKGFYALVDDGRFIRITDLRMGQHPYFVFSFAFAEHHSEPLLPIAPFQVSQRMPLAPGLRWLWARLLGQDVPIPRQEEI